MYVYACICIYINHISKFKEFVTQLCLILCDPMDCSPPGSFVHGILQARILEWVAVSFSKKHPWTIACSNFGVPFLKQASSEIMR